VHQCSGEVRDKQSVSQGRKVKGGGIWNIKIGTNSSESVKTETGGEIYI